MIKLVCIHDGQRLVRPSESRFECPRCSAVFNVLEDIPRFLPDRVDPAQAQVKDAFSFKWSRDEWGFKPKHIELMRSFFWDRFCFSQEKDVASLFGDRVVLHAGIGSGQAEQHYLEHCREVWGIDLSESIDACSRNWKKYYPELLPKLKLVQADLMAMPFENESFDIVLSDGVLHHTPDTFKALKAVTEKVKIGGLVVFYVYKKKAPIREFVDDFIRDQIRDLPPDKAWKKLEPLTTLARELSHRQVRIQVPEAIDLLEMSEGEYDLQRWIYWNIMKLYWNDSLNFDENNHVNFDWYYPAYAWRHTPGEIKLWLSQLNLEALHFQVGESGISVVARREGR